MDIGGDNGTINSALRSFLHTLALCMGDDDTINGLPGLLRNGFDSTGQGGLFKSLVGNTDSTEGTIATGIHNMKSQVLITESFGLLHNCSPKHLFGAHAMGPAVLVFNAIGEILPDKPGNDRVAIKNLADVLQLFGSWVVDGCDHQGHLILLFLAHFGATPFFVLVVVIGCGDQFITTR